MSATDKPSMKDRDFVALGFIVLQSQTGYQLRKIIEEFVFIYPNIDFSQFYPSLSKLHDKSYVTIEEIPQDGKPDKKVYHATQSGTDAVKEWLLQPTTKSGIAAEQVFLLKQPFLPLLNASQLETVVTVQKQAVQQEITAQTNKIDHYQTWLDTPERQGVQQLANFRTQYLHQFHEWLNTIPEQTSIQNT